VPRIIADTKTFFLKNAVWDLMLVMILSVVRMQMLVHKLAVPVHMLVNQVCGRQ
jgi:type IV secretory pathway VirB3-like protein